MAMEGVEAVTATAATETQQGGEVRPENFGGRDSVRITAPIAAQQDVDAVAKSLRKAGARAQNSCLNHEYYTFLSCAPIKAQ